MNYSCVYNQIDVEKTGQRIMQLLTESKIDVKTLANTIGISNQSVYKWINGRSLPTLENIYQISKILDVPIDEIVVGSDPIQYTTPEIYVREKCFVQELRTSNYKLDVFLLFKCENCFSKASRRKLWISQ